eukprot:4165254-Prymnesium_polylepis.1
MCASGRVVRVQARCEYDRVRAPPVAPCVCVPLKYFCEYVETGHGRYESSFVCHQTRRVRGVSIRSPQMFEQAVATVLQKVLGQFIKGIDAESLKLSVWNGDIKLVNLELNTEPIDALGLPVAVLGGSVGAVRVEVPWRSLNTKPIIVSVERLYVLIAPKDVGTWDREAEEARVRQWKREQLELWETVQREKSSFEAMNQRMADQL